MSKTTSVVATFGAALAIPAASADAAVVNLSFSPSSVLFSGYETIGLGAVPGGSTFGTFLAFNDSVGKSFGSNFSTVAAIPYFSEVSAGDTISTFSLSGAAVYASPSATGTLLAGFETAAGLVGWLRVDFGTGAGETVTFVNGAIETTGDSIVAGQLAPVPLPATLPLLALSALALGAVGVRRRRSQKAA